MTIQLASYEDESTSMSDSYEDCSSPNSSYTEQKRLQSPSPQRLNVSCELDNKRERTPRKDTPVKKKARFKCRNNGCNDFLGSSRARICHETKYCLFKLESKAKLSAKSYPVPSHAELHLDVQQCRICLSRYGNEKARKRHEKETHSLYEIQGRTFSTLPLDSIDLIDETARPQS